MVRKRGDLILYILIAVVLVSLVYAVVVDTDGDKVPDESDNCLDSTPDKTVDSQGCDCNQKTASDCSGTWCCSSSVVCDDSGARAICTTCTDDVDRGINYYSPGMAISNGQSYSDSCSGNVLTEYYCDGGSLGTKTYTFTESCTDGACAESNTCINSEKDEGESDIDCGGAICDGCIAGKLCNANSDCQSNYCEDSICAKISTTACTWVDSTIITSGTQAQYDDGSYDTRFLCANGAWFNFPHCKYLNEGDKCGVWDYYFTGSVSPRYNTGGCKVAYGNYMPDLIDYSGWVYTDWADSYSEEYSKRCGQGIECQDPLDTSLYFPTDWIGISDGNQQFLCYEGSWYSCGWDTTGADSTDVNGVTIYNELNEVGPYVCDISAYPTWTEAESGCVDPNNPEAGLLFDNDDYYIYDADANGVYDEGNDPRFLCYDNQWYQCGSWAGSDGIELTNSYIDGTTYNSRCANIEGTSYYCGSTNWQESSDFCGGSVISECTGGDCILGFAYDSGKSYTVTVTIGGKEYSMEITP